MLLLYLLKYGIFIKINIHTITNNNKIIYANILILSLTSDSIIIRNKDKLNIEHPYNPGNGAWESLQENRKFSFYG